jgi:RNA polymerase sigma factor (sigma-70 family)
MTKGDEPMDAGSRASPGGTPDSRRHESRLRAEPPTREQLEAMRSRDPEALGLLFDRYFDSLYSLVHRLVGTREQAEDVTQDVFYRACRSIETLDPARDPGAWLVTIAVNACRDFWRRADTRAGRKSRPFEDVEETSELTSQQPDPEEALRLRRRRQGLEAALGALPEALRLPILLRDFAGFDHAEIAGLLEASPEAVRKRYSRGLAALAEQLREDRS